MNSSAWHRSRTVSKGPTGVPSGSWGWLNSPCRVFGTVADELGETIYSPIPGGWLAEHDDGRTEALFLNPSNTDPKEDNPPNVFLYRSAGNPEDLREATPILWLPTFTEEVAT